MCNGNYKQLATNTAIYHTSYLRKYVISLLVKKVTIFFYFKYSLIRSFFLHSHKLNFLSDVCPKFITFTNSVYLLIKKNSKRKHSAINEHVTRTTIINIRRRSDIDRIVSLLNNFFFLINSLLHYQIHYYETIRLLIANKQEQNVIILLYIQSSTQQQRFTL